MKTAAYISLGAVGLAALLGVHYDATYNDSTNVSAAIDTISSAIGQRLLQSNETVTADPCSYVRLSPLPDKFGCGQLAGSSCQPVGPDFAFFLTVTVGLGQTHACLCTEPGFVNKPGVLNGGCDPVEAQCEDNTDCGENGACDGASIESGGGGAKCFCIPGFVNTGVEGVIDCTPIQPTAIVLYPGFNISLAFLSDGTQEGEAAALAAIEAALEAYLLGQLSAEDVNIVAVNLVLSLISSSNNATSGEALLEGASVQTVGNFTATQSVVYNVNATGDVPSDDDQRRGNAVNEDAVANEEAINGTLAPLDASTTGTDSEETPLATPAPTPAPVPDDPGPAPTPTAPTGRRFLFGAGTEIIRGELPEATVGEQLKDVIVSKSSGSLSERIVHVAARGFPTMMAFSIMEAEAGDIEILHYTKETMAAKIKEVSDLLSTRGVLGFRDYFVAQTSLDKQLELWSLATLWVDGGVVFDPTYQALAPLEMWATLEGQEEVATCLSDDESRFTSSFIAAKKNASTVLNAIKSMVEKKLTMTEALKTEEAAVRVGCKIEEEESSLRLATFANGKTGDVTFAKKSTAVKQQ